MAIDVVHDSQYVFRTVLDCMSRPGTIKNLHEVTKNALPIANCFRSTLVTAITLLDSETSFYVIDPEAEKLEELFIAFTRAKKLSIQQADFIIITERALQSSLEEAFLKASKGTLANPHESATIIMETEQVKLGGNLLMKGPGIENMEDVTISNFQRWIEHRQLANIEFPLGIDMIIVDSESNVLCIPRTTRLHY